jgi:hypothetical protein
MIYPLILALLLCSACLPSQSTIVKHSKISSIERYIPADIPKKDILVVLDLDDTVGMSVLDQNLAPLWDKVLAPRKQAPKLKFKERLNYILKLKPMEDETVNFLQKIQASGIPVIILTARTANLYKRTYDQLKKIGLDFSSSLSLGNHTLTSKTLKPVPFFNGILLCSKQNKGETLNLFITNNNLSPKKIIFVDDVSENIVAVDQATKELSIDCTSIMYTRKKKYGWTGRAKYSLKSLFGSKA